MSVDPFGQTILRLSDCRVDLANRCVLRGDEEVPLTPIEGDLLTYLAQRAGQAVSREELLSEVWSYRPGVNTRAVDHTVSRLRAKIEPGKTPRHLLTVRGHGLRLVLPSRADAPEPLTPLIGRAELVNELVSGDWRLCTLHGPGGAGKTRIAQEGARRLLSAGSAILWVDLQDADDLSVAVASAMGTSPQEVALALEAHSGVVVLDTFEVVIDQAQTLCAWLSQAPTLRVLTTSQIRLDVPAEHVVFVPPLSEEDAVRLFMERAKAVTPSEADPELLARIVRAVDRLPLAIELLAARAGLLGPRELCDRLHRAVELARGAGRTDVPRHASLEEALRWSHSLLDRREARALADVSVFRGGFSLDAAEAVLGEDAVQLLGRLADHGMLKPRPERLALFDTVRQFVAPQLDDSVRLKHAEYFARFGTEEAARDLDRHGGRDHWDRLQQELPNLLAAASFSASRGHGQLAGLCALAAERILRLRGSDEALLRVLDRVLQVEGIPVSVCSRLLRRRGWTHMLAGRLDAADSDLERALALSASEAERAQILAGQGAILHYRGAFELAEERMLESLSLAEALDDRQVQGTTLANLGYVSRRRGKLQEARRRYARALAIHREVGNRRSEGNALGDLAAVVYHLGDLDSAAELYADALVVHRETGNRRGEANVLLNLCGVAADQGDTDRALELAERAAELHRASGNLRMHAAALGNMGEALLRLGRFTDAEVILEQAVAGARRSGYALAEGAFMGALAECLASLGESEECLRLYESAVEVVEPLQAPLELAGLRVRGAVIAARIGAVDAGPRLLDARTAVEALGVGGNHALVERLDAVQRLLPSP